MIFRAKVQAIMLCSHPIFAKVKVHNNAHCFSANVPVVLTIGTFDGVHHGHRAVIALLKQRAADLKGTSVLLTFHPHPRVVLQPEHHGLRLLNSLEERKQLLSESGLDHLVIQPFTEELSRMSPLEYVKELFVNGIKPSAVIIGYDHRFGRNREGTFESLKNLGDVFGFSVESLPAQTIENTRISSTKVREAIEMGKVLLARQWLLSPFPLSGKVVQGNQIGRKIGFPTANLEVEDAIKLIPRTGVYAAFAQYNTESEWHPAMVNIGKRPTIDPTNTTDLVEVHFLSGGRSCYLEVINLRFIKRLRDECLFKNLEALQSQLQQDSKDAVLSLNQTADPSTS
jgi:riboflavin kinase/FMN adenylyltransferase